MTDSDIVKLARRIDKLNWKIHLLVGVIAESEHPNAERLVEDLQSNNFDNPAWATHVISHGLEDPDAWATGYFRVNPPDGIRRAKRKKKE